MKGEWVPQQATPSRPFGRGREQVHSCYNGRPYYHQVGHGHVLKKARKSRWEWRPVTRRSTASQTLPTESRSIGVGPSLPSSTDPVELVKPVEMPSQVNDSLVNPITDAFRDSPSLPRLEMGQEDRTGEELKDLVAAGLELAPVPMVALLRKDIRAKECHTSSTSKCHDPPTRSFDSDTSKGNSSAVHIAEEDEAVNNSDDTLLQHLNRKQRKHFKKKQKKRATTIRISSLPILKSWKSSSSSSQSSIPSSSSPWKIYDCSKAFGPLGSPSAKSITWTVSSKPPSYISSKNAAAHVQSKKEQPENAASFDRPGSSGFLTVKPIWTLTGSVALPEEKVIHEISEISESPKSYLGEWMDDNESFRRSQSDPEEIEMDVPHSDFDFEADSEDYSFQA